MTTNRKIIYLVQGQAKLVAEFLFLEKRSDVDAIFLTYDHEIDGALFRPGSTWGEGRNILIEEAKKRREWIYCIFCDDDISFARGSFEEFEKELFTYQPAIGVPVFSPKTQHTVAGIGKGYGMGFFIPFFRRQICRFADAQYMAFHRSVIDDNLVGPLQTQFDSVSWWCTSSTQQLLMFNIYKDNVLQFNKISVRNLEHRQYQNDPFQKIQDEWFEKQFLAPIEDIRNWVFNIFSVDGLRKMRKARPNLPAKVRYPRFIKEYFSLIFDSIKYKPQNSYALNEKALSDILKPESELMRQHTSKK